MKCPYCAEDIKDEATFCHHCSHDFGLVKPLLARLILLEKEAEALNSVVTITSSTGQAASFSLFAAVIAVVFCVVLTSGYFIAGRQGDIKPYILALALPPAAFGLILGVVGSRRSPPAFFISGFAIGILNFILLALTLGSGFQWPLALVTLVIGQALTFATCAFYGNSLRRSGWPLFKNLRAEDVVGRAEDVVGWAKRLTDALKSLGALGATVVLAYQWLREVFQ